MSPSIACEEVDSKCQQYLFSQLKTKLTPEESASCDGPVSLSEITEIYQKF